jgi:sterol desaturase/sphingolipid hydroxylase (fatty acid hydroxylase superfamily)
MNILVSISIITGTFSISTITAFFICYLNKYPFINPNFEREKQLERINDYIMNVPVLLFQSTGFMYLFSDNIIPYGKHTWLGTCYSIFLYCLLIEANYYAYHRFIHKYYYEHVHKKHHSNVVVYPFDTFYLTSIDDAASIVSIGLPVVFMKISAVEQIFILYIYITTSYFSHSDLFWKHHKIHHQLLNYNYCILFPIFDIIFGTYKK